MEVYEDVYMTYSRKKEDLKDWFDFKNIYEHGKKLDKFLGEGLLQSYGEEYIESLKEAINRGPCFCVCEKDEYEHFLDVRCQEVGDTIRVYNIRMMGSISNWSYKNFFKEFNRFFKDKGYKKVAYYFNVAHNLKPDINREDYDIVYRLGATEDYMGYRCYVKKLV